MSFSSSQSPRLRNETQCYNNYTSSQHHGQGGSLLDLYITGDIHGKREIRRLVAENFSKGEGLTRNDLIVILGDFGLLWSQPPTESERYWLNWLERRSWTTLFLDGNHDNHSMLNRLPVEDHFGAPAGIVRPHIYHLKRGYVYDICGKSCFVMGGARSLDRSFRTPGRNWWPEEIPCREEMDRGVRSLDRHNWQVDYVLTHTAPTSVIKKIYAEIYGGKRLTPGPVMKYLEEVRLRLKYERWFCGHLHFDRYYQEENIRVVYGDILKVS